MAQYNTNSKLDKAIFKRTARATREINFHIAPHARGGGRL